MEFLITQELNLVNENEKRSSMILIRAILGLVMSMFVGPISSELDTLTYCIPTIITNSRRDS